MKELMLDIIELIIMLFCDCGIFAFLLLPIFLVICIIGIPPVALYAIFQYLNDIVKLKAETYLINFKKKNIDK